MKYAALVGVLFILVAVTIPAVVEWQETQQRGLRFERLDPRAWACTKRIERGNCAQWTLKGYR